MSQFDVSLIGYLGSNEVDAIQSRLVYSPPSGHSAKVKIMFYASSASVSFIRINDNRIYYHPNTDGAKITAVPQGDEAGVPRIMDLSQTDVVHAPLPQEYYLTSADGIYVQQTSSTGNLECWAFGVEFVDG